MMMMIILMSSSLMSGLLRILNHDHWSISTEVTTHTPVPGVGTAINCIISRIYDFGRAQTRKAY